jgi:integrase
MFAYAVAQDVLETSVVAGIPNMGVERSRDRTLSHDEITELWNALPENDTDDIGNDIRNAIKLLLIAGQRTGESRQMEWSELSGNMWSIPPEKQKKRKNKKGTVHLVPLPDLAMEIIESQKKKTGNSTYVFSGQGGEQYGDRCISENAIATAFRRITREFNWERTTVHDLRRTMRSELSRLKVDIITAEKVINHKIGGILGIYDRYDYLDEKAVALQKWGKCLEKLVYPKRKQSNVIDFPKEKMAS